MTDDLQDQIARAAAVLKAAGAREVYVFGSAATGTMDEHSDIDLAVSGLLPEAFYGATFQAGMAIKHELDVIDLDEDTLFTQYLRRKGKLQRVA